MRDYNYMWRNTSGSDSTAQIDSATQYDGTAGGQLFWDDWLSIPLLWITPKTDWTSQDFYNADDLNSVELNTVHVANVLSDYRSSPITLTNVTDRTMTRIEFYDSMNRVEGNIKTLADNFFTPIGWEAPKTTWASGLPGGGFSWKDAIRLEKDLKLLYELVLKSIETIKYCGTFTCGEVDVI